MEYFVGLVLCIIVVALIIFGRKPMTREMEGLDQTIAKRQIDNGIVRAKETDDGENLASCAGLCGRSPRRDRQRAGELCVLKTPQARMNADQKRFLEISSTTSIRARCE